MGAHLLDLGEQIAREEDRRSLAIQLQQQAPDLLAGLWVEAIARLIQDQQRRSAHESGRQTQQVGCVGQPNLGDR
jgi:hypothetical protein